MCLSLPFALSRVAHNMAANFQERMSESTQHLIQWNLASGIPSPLLRSICEQQANKPSPHSRGLLHERIARGRSHRRSPWRLPPSEAHTMNYLMSTVGFLKLYIFCIKTFEYSLMLNGLSTDHK